MATTQVETIAEIEEHLNALKSTNGRVANFAYEDSALRQREIGGVDNYDFDAAQNIPLASKTDTPDIVLRKGIRAQGMSIGREFQNHFTGRVSFNLNLLVELFSDFITRVKEIFRKNDNLYDPTVKYSVGDVVYTIEPIGDVRVKRSYRARQDVNLSNAPSATSELWSLLEDEAAYSKSIENNSSLSFNELTKQGVYTCALGGAALAIKNGPGYLDGSPGAFILTVKSDLTDSGATTFVTQSILFVNDGIEYTRTFLSQPGGAVAVKEDWYVTKDPKGIRLIGANELWVFRVEDGDLVLYYNKRDDGVKPPNLFIDDDGFLIWDYLNEQEGG